MLATKRTSPCLSPFQHVYIDYNGKVMPCCNLRSDLPAHQDAIIADLHASPDLFLVYAGRTLAAWRGALVGFDPKSGYCATCSFGSYARTPEHASIHERLQEEAARAGGHPCLAH